MRDEAFRRALWLTSFALLLRSTPAAPATPTTFVAELTGHYTQYQTFAAVLRADSTLGLARQTTSYWTQSYRGALTTMLRERTNLFAEIRYTDVSYVDGSQRNQVPSGLLRLTNPIYGVTASYRPTRSNRQITAPGDTAGTGQRTEQLIRNSDMFLTAYVAPSPRLPRVEGQWIQRHQEATETVPAATGTQRMLRATQQFSGLVFQGGYSDQLSRRDGLTRTLARSWDAGASYGGMFGRQNPLQLSYAYQGSELPGRNGWIHNQTHSANANGAWRIDRRQSLDGGGFYRHTELRDGTHSTVQDYDVYGYHHYDLRNGLGTRAGGGMRSFRDTSGVHDSPYVLASISADGMPRPGWRARAGFSHSTNWFGDGPPANSEALDVASTFEFSRTFEVHGLASTAVRTGALQNTTGRYSTQLTGGLSMVPLRSTRLAFDASQQTYGPEMFGVGSRSNTESASLQWNPSRSLSLLLQRSRSGAFPANRPRSTTTSVVGAWRLSRTLQIDGNYMKFEDSQLSTTLARPGSESYGVRIANRFTRRLSALAGYQQANRGRPTESRYLDVSATYRFDL
jgi:hypothetical protein